MPTPHELIKEVQGKVLQFKASQLSLSETETRRALIDPIFVAIGWDMGNPIAVRMEWRKNPGDRPVDYAFMINGMPKLLVEAERLKENISDKKWEDQLLWYSSKLGVKWCALTNGNIIRVYNSLAEEAAEDKLLFEIEVQTIDTPDGLPINVFMEKLSLLSEQNLRARKIDEVWDDVYATKKVFDCLKVKKEDLTDYVVRGTKLTKKSVGEVLDQIIELRESFLKEKQAVPIGEEEVPTAIGSPQPSVAQTGYAALFDSTGKPVKYAGKKPLSFWFRGSVYEVNSWKDLLLKLCNIVNAEHRGEFDKVLKLAGFTRSENQYEHHEKIHHTDIYVTTRLSAFQIITYCGKLLDKFGYRKDDMRIKIRNT